MAVRIKRPIYDLDGNPISGATVKVYEVGQTGVVSTHTTDTNGYIDLSLDDDRGGRTNVAYDLEISVSGNVWWIRGLDEGQLASLDVKDYLRIPKYSTTDRDALSLGATDAGHIIYNTTDSVIQHWNGTSWDTMTVGAYTINALTQSEYDALASKDPDTLYFTPTA